MESNNSRYGSSIEILVVEDSRLQAEMLKQVLEDEGYSVTVASDGAKGFYYARTRRPALVLSDINMPKMDGCEMCRELKSDPETSDLPVILVSQLMSAEDIILGLEAGADGYITKPYEADYLLEEIRHLLFGDGLNDNKLSEGPIELAFRGKKHTITSGRKQILGLLLSTYENSVRQNHKLIETEKELKRLNEHLDQQVRDRTESLMNEIAERKAVEQQLQVSQKLEALGRLAGGVAHDFNNCLCAIIGFAELSMMQMEPGNRLYQNMKSINGSAQRAAGITRQLLAFSRKQIIETKVLNINDIISDLGKMLKRLIVEDIELMTNLSPDLGCVNADVTQIEQVLMNLVVNARDAMPKGGKVVIETSNVQIDDAYAKKHNIDIKPSDYIMLSVSDTGTGMSEDIRSRIFEPFFTTKEAGKGTGLGLSTVYGIVKQNNGHIYVYSEEGKGTIFNIYFERVDIKPEEITAKKIEKVSEHRGNATILVVEDDVAIRKSTVSMLQMHGYRVLDAIHGAEALAFFERGEHAVDLLLTDVVMPHMSGPELVKRLNSMNKEVKVLFMSGYTDDITLHHGLLDSGTNFIGKPFSLAQLLKKVGGLVGNGNSGRCELTKAASGH